MASVFSTNVPQISRICPDHMIVIYGRIVWNDDISGCFGEPYIIWLSLMVYLCNMMISPSLFFFHFFQISFFGLLEGGQRGKMTQNDKRLCSLCLISQELYIIWSSFMVHISCFFSHFSQILIFRVNSGVNGQKKKKKKGLKMTKILSCCISQEPYIIWLSFMVHLWKMIISPGVFFFFSKFWFSG